MIIEPLTNAFFIYLNELIKRLKRTSNDFWGISTALWSLYKFYQNNRVHYYPIFFEFQ